MTVTWSRMDSKSAIQIYVPHNPIYKVYKVKDIILLIVNSSMNPRCST